MKAAVSYGMLALLSFWGVGIVGGLVLLARIPRASDRFGSEIKTCFILMAIMDGLLLIGLSLLRLLP